MQTAETLLTIGTLVLLGVFSLTLYSNQAQDSHQMYSSQQMEEAISIAQRFIEEAAQLHFDENSEYSTPSYFSTTLGADAGEIYSRFDDVDDFNRFSTTVTAGSVPFTIRIAVQYVDKAKDFAPSSVRTSFKMMTLTVSAAQDTTQKAVMGKLFAYHYFFTE